MPELIDKKQLDEICDQHLFSLPWFRGMLRAVEHSFYAKEELAEPIIDIGAGDGHFASAAFKNKEIIGIDPWFAPINEARGLRVYPLLLQAEGASLPFPEACFASAVSNSVLEHVMDLEPVLKDVARVLKPSAKFYFAVPNDRFKTDLWGISFFEKLGIRPLARTYGRFFNRIARHQHLESSEVWKEKLQNAGFGPVECFNYFPKWALHKLERGHLWGLPNLLWKKLFNKWILFPSRKNPFIPWEMARKLLEHSISEEGSCTFYIATRKADI